MQAILHVIWQVLSGLWIVIRYALTGLLAFVLSITISCGIAAFRIAGYALWPFGRMIKPRHGAGALASNINWIILVGWWLALGHQVTGLLLCPTVIGIPLGIANFKIIPISLMPLGTRIIRTGSCAPARAMPRSRYVNRPCPEASAHRRRSAQRCAVICYRVNCAITGKSGWPQIAACGRVPGPASNDERKLR
jgi:uncharacterized membrane protein YccF (DUF307 family)